MRIFIAFEVEKEYLAPILDELNEYEEKVIDFRWTFNDNLHITLCFFRDLNDIGINILNNAIKYSIQNIGPIEFNTDYIITLPPGLWRNKYYGYVSGIRPYNGIALNINKGKDKIKKIYEDIENNLIKFGKENDYLFRPKEKRIYIPHITLGRKKWKQSVFHKFNYSKNCIIEGLLKKIIIYQSELNEINPNRMHKLFPKYTKLYEFDI
jgi:2'-5' RNA ligase